MAFTHTWNFIQSNLKPGQKIDNWTIRKGNLGDRFKIQSVSPNTIHVDTPGAQTIQHVPRDDFEGVYSIWSQYKALKYERSRIRDDVTRFSKYIISILRWVEIGNGGTLP